MFPTRLNLLSPNKKNVLERIIFFQFIKNLFQILLIVFCIAGILLLGSQSVLQRYFNQLASNLTAVNNSYTDANRKIQDINRLLKNADMIQKEYQVWIPIIEQVAKAIPPGIQLIKLELSQKKVMLSGVAKTRDDLLMLQTKLKNMDCSTICIQDADLPPSQLTKKEDISFSITANIK